MHPAILWLTLCLAPAAPTASPQPGTAESPIILFLLDNSASLPPLDPNEKRVAALEQMFSFLQGQKYRLVLFGGRQEMYVDDVTRYRNDGQWTDFYFAFETAHGLMAGYPKGTEFRMILVTDGIMDPQPSDWESLGLPKGADLKTQVTHRLLSLVEQMHVPLYVILVGELPAKVAAGSTELAPKLILDLVGAANGAKASPMAQRLSSFFEDDGVLLKKFVFRVAPYQGLPQIERVVRRIVAPARGLVELRFLGALLGPLVLILFLLLGILVRSFPGPGDLEIIELSLGVPVHVAADRLHKLDSGWATTGLSLVADAKEAGATLTYGRSSVDLSGQGLPSEGLDAQTLRLLTLDLDGLRRALHEYADSGTKEEKIYALNLDYMAKSFDSSEAERILTSAAAERRGVQPLDFLRAKAHLLSNEPLRLRLTEPRVQMLGYGPKGQRMDLMPGSTPRIGRYRFVVKSADRGGRKDLRLVLYYDRVPSLLGLKNWLPDLFQRVSRFRRSSQRIVT